MQLQLAAPEGRNAKSLAKTSDVPCLSMSAAAGSVHVGEEGADDMVPAEGLRTCPSQTTVTMIGGDDNGEVDNNADGNATFLASKGAVKINAEEEGGGQSGSEKKEKRRKGKNFDFFLQHVVGLRAALLAWGWQQQLPHLRGASSPLVAACPQC